MKTLANKQSAQKATISLPNEIIEQILCRLPIKSFIRFKSVSKPWLSLISNPSFTKLHSTLGPRTTSLFFTLVDSSTNTRYFFSGANTDNGSVANLIKLDNTYYGRRSGRAQHSNGLVFFTSRTSVQGSINAYIINPTTHKFFKLPDPPAVTLPNYTWTDDEDRDKDLCYFFGFDELTNDHKVLYFDVGVNKLNTIEIMIFSFLNYTWRKINVDLPFGMCTMRWFFCTGHGVCVNSTIHLMHQSPSEILAFDLTTEKFCIVNIPPEAVPETMSIYDRWIHDHDTSFVNVNGLFGVCCIDQMEGSKKLNISDYENRVWVRETIKFPRNSHQYRAGDMGEIIFYPEVLSENMIKVPIYDMKTRCFKSIQLTLGHRFLCPESAKVEEIKCYVESLSPLQN